MSSLIPAIKTDAIHSDSNTNKNESSKGKIIGFAIVIITGIGSMIVFGVGVGSYLGSISISQGNGVIMAVTGGTGGIVFLIIGIVGSVKNCPLKNKRQNKDINHIHSQQSKGAKITSVKLKPNPMQSITISNAQSALQPPKGPDKELHIDKKNSMYSATPWEVNEEPYPLPKGWNKHQAEQTTIVHYDHYNGETEITIPKGDTYFTFNGKVVIGWGKSYNPPESIW